MVALASYCDKLAALVPPPRLPFEAATFDAFQDIESHLGLQLPADFKTLICTYGSGQWQDFWYLLNPFSKNQYLNLVTQSSDLTPRGCSTLDAERRFRAAFPAEYPYSIYPEPGGILPWAKTDNGGRFFWLTAGKPDTWVTVYYADRSPESETFAMSCSELLYKAVTGELQIFSQEFGEAHEYGRSDVFKPLNALPT